MESASRDIVALICRSLEFPSDKMCGDISRVLKPGGTVLLSLSSQSVSKVCEMSLCTYFFRGELVWALNCPFGIAGKLHPRAQVIVGWIL